MLGGQVASQRGTTAPGIRQRVQGKPAGWVVSTAGELSRGGARLLGLGRAGRPGREVILGARLAGHQRRPTVSRESVTLSRRTAITCRKRDLLRGMMRRVCPHSAQAPFIADLARRVLPECLERVQWVRQGREHPDDDVDATK